MTEMEIFEFVKTHVDAALTANGVQGEMVQAFQPTSQGIEPRVQVFMTKISDHFYGFHRREDVWNEDTEVFDHSETQQVETLFQMGAVAPDITNPMKPKVRVTTKTSADVLGIVAATLRSDAFVAAIHAIGCGVQRITDLRNPFFKDDHDQNRASPSFDFTISHKQVTMFAVPEATPIRVETYRV